MVSQITIATTNDAIALMASSEPSTLSAWPRILTINAGASVAAFHTRCGFREMGRVAYRKLLPACFETVF